ncbi:MAG: protein-L-isoaspartate(D-aspartate) O-methyltransferase [Acidobacteria bacterium]|nr:MAG: protein-L-isoaspartate(D-aspartate) O-methyltransferase [Acidobacteriota bacterium]
MTSPWLTWGLSICLVLAGGSQCNRSATPSAEKKEPQRELENRRRMMVDAQLKARGIENSRVLKAMGKVPRHEFIPPGMREYAYHDTPLPIGDEQTISQPYIVALMTELANPKRDDRVLEVGTGSGYQAAVLAELASEVYSIEILAPLAERARATLERLKYKNVYVRAGDGYRGWPEMAPFAAILVTAAAERIPQPLVDQLADNGRLIIPVGGVGDLQSLTVITRKGDRFERQEVLPVRFVPMTGEVQKP